MTNKEFVNRVLEIAATNPTYRTGGDGSDGTCDCIGLVMGALGGEFPMHSTNWFARYRMENGVESREPDDDLYLGDLVYKARNPGNPRYDLHERYRDGGRYFTGDLTDYYHVGVVTQEYPLRITHCTSGNGANGIVTDTSADGWTHFGMIGGLVYEDDEACAEEETSPEIREAMVIAENGFTVNMRQRPDKAAPILLAVPIGETVTVEEEAQGWAAISYQGKRGYMMTKFLDFTEEESVIITISKSAAAALKAALANINL